VLSIPLGMACPKLKGSGLQGAVSRIGVSIPQVATCNNRGFHNEAFSLVDFRGCLPGCPGFDLRRDQLGVGRFVRLQRRIERRLFGRRP
jgi:hypothetical protein